MIQASFQLDFKSIKIAAILEPFLERSKIVRILAMKKFLYILLHLYLERYVFKVSVD